MARVSSRLPTSARLVEGNPGDARSVMVFDNMMNGMAYCRMLYDEDGPHDFEYLAVNPAFEAQTGLADVVGKRVSEVIPGIRERDPDLFETYGRVARTGAPERFEYYLRSLGMWLDISVFSPERDHFVALFDVITERKRAEAVLRESEERYRVLFESAHDAIMTLVPPSWRFTSCNPATVRMFGVKSELEFTARGAWDYSPPVQPDGRASIEKAREMIAIAMRDGSHFFDWVHRRANGEAFPATVLLARCELGGRSVLQATVRDITERKAMQEQILASQRLEAIGLLAGGVAHDFNNLLSIILSSASFALDELGEEDPARLDIREIKESAERAAALTNQLLAFSRKQVLEPQVLDTNAIVRRVTKMLRRLLGENIELVLDLATDVGKVYADPAQIEQVIVNLCVNARDAMPRGGNLIISSACVELDEESVSRHGVNEPGAHVVLAIVDTGSGMDEATRKRVFEPFFTTKERSKGTGLGLATVYGIVRQTGGNITVESEPGKGSTFRVYLPQTEDRLPGTARRSEAPPRGAGEVVLLAEDQEGVRKVTERILRQAGYRVLCASNGDEAVQVFHEHAGNVDLLLTDVVMPGMSGRELAERLAAEKPGLPTLYMSGYTDEAIVHNGVLVSGERIVAKPFSPATLGRKVRDALDAQGEE